MDDTACVKRAELIYNSQRLTTVRLEVARAPRNMDVWFRHSVGFGWWYRLVLLCDVTENAPEIRPATRYYIAKI